MHDFYYNSNNFYEQINSPGSSLRWNLPLYNPFHALTIICFCAGVCMWVVWSPPWNPGTSFFLLHSLPLTSSHLLLIPPSYFTLLPNLLLTPPNSSYLLPKGLRWLISSYMKRFQCYSAQKSFLGGWVVVVGDIAIIATSSRSRSLIRDLR